MENNLGEKKNITHSEVRVILIGGRWAGKSSSGNTILRQERFECGRTRTAQTEVRHEVVDGRKLIVVDAPGWRSSLSLREIPEVDIQRFKLNPSKCPPGPQVFLLVIPIDSAFSAEQRKTVEEHMKLLGERVWRYTMVLFTCGDFLGEKTIEQHIESEGHSLKWLIERCRNRYHVFNNKEKRNLSQVTLLLQKIDEMVWHNNGSYYKVDEQTSTIIKEKEREVTERATKRQRRAEEQRQHMKTLVPEEMKPIPKLQMILLGSRSTGKTSVGNTVLGIKDQEVGKRTARSVARRGSVGETEITLVDTPGWWKGFPALNTPEVIKEELMRSMFLCPPGPHVFLVVIDADASFNAKHLEAVTTHMELLGEEVWRRTLVVFTRGDWLGTHHTIEEYIEGEGEALQSLVELCGNRYHVIDNKNTDDGTQITELLEKIIWTVAENNWGHFVPDEQIVLTIDKKRRGVEERARLRESQVKAKTKTLRDSANKLQELRIMMLGQKTSGKSATGNNLLHKEVFPTRENELCQVEEGEVAGRRITVIDTPGWRRKARCTEDIDKEIVSGLSLSPLGVHAILLVIPLDLVFTDVQKVALEEHMNLFDASVWKHTMVLFTYGDKLADRCVEEHIEREHRALCWVVDMCENKYHVMNNVKKTDLRQVTELFEKIEEMVEGNSGRLFCPDMKDIHLRIDEKFRRRQIKNMLKERLAHEYRKRELELKMGFKETLLELQAEIRESMTSTKLKSLIRGTGTKRKDGKEQKETTDAKISRKIEKLNKEILTSINLLQGSKDCLIPSLNGDSPPLSIAESLPDRKKPTSHFDKVLCWLSTMQIRTNEENNLTLDFSQTSGYRSVLPHDDLDFDIEADTSQKLTSCNNMTQYLDGSSGVEVREVSL